MRIKPISAKLHALLDYALVGSLLTLPFILGLNKKAKRIYAAEALLLLPYVGFTKQPVALKGLIPFKIHGKIDQSTFKLEAICSCLNHLITIPIPIIPE